MLTASLTQLIWRCCWGDGDEMHDDGVVNASHRNSYDVIVIGLGAMGSNALASLARRGKRVLGIDRFDPPHSLGSSHGGSRVIRLSYFEHADYVPLLKHAYLGFDRLARESGVELRTENGLIMGGAPGNRGNWSKTKSLATRLGRAARLPDHRCARRQNPYRQRKG